MSDLFRRSIKQLLHGAASVLGGSASGLIIFDEPNDRLALSLGVLRKKDEELKQVEELLGLDTSDLTVPISLLPKSHIVRCWREAKVYQTHTVIDLVRGLVDEDQAKRVDEMVGPHTYLCVPAIGSRHVEGVVIFEKEGNRGFAPVQAKLLLQYASRVARLLEAERLGRQASEILDLGQGQDMAPSMGLVITDENFHVIFSRLFDGLPEPRPQTPLQDWLDDLSSNSAQTRVNAEMLLSNLDSPVRVGFDANSGGESRLTLRMSHVPSLSSYVLIVVDTGPVEHKLSEVGDRLPMLLSGTASAVICISSDLKILSSNDLAEQLFNVGSNGLVGRDLMDLIDKGSNIEVATKGRLGAFGYLDQVVNMRRSDDTVFPAHIMGVLLADETGSPDGALLAIEDIGDASAQEQESLRLDMEAQKAQRLKAMGEMAAQLAHELRNPLVALGALLQSLVEDPPDQSEMEQELEAARAEVTRLDALLQDYLALAGRVRLEPTSVNLADIVRATVDLSQAVAAGKGVDVHASMSRELTVIGDPQGLKQVLLNVLLNAIQASPDSSEIELKVEPSGDTCQVMVRDFGPGIPKEARSKIFEPFFTTRGDGTGLGLTVCKQIMDELGGRIWCEEPGDDLGGAKFVLELPRA